MVKLLRLISEKSDSINSEPGLTFNVNMDADLVISENAQIAVKNLTFEADFVALDVTTESGLIIGQYESSRSPFIRFLKTQLYTASNYLTFFKDMRITLNGTLSALLNTEGSSSFKQGFYGQYFIDDDSEIKSIQFRLSPAICPVIARGITSPDPVQWSTTQALMNISRATDDTETLYIDYDELATPLKAADMCRVYQIQDALATNIRKNYISPTSQNVAWSQGSGVWWCRIQDLTDNTGDANTNGFELGLSAATPFGQPGEIIADDNVLFAIRCERPGDDYKFIIPDATTMEPKTPLAYSTSVNRKVSVSQTNVGNNDVLMIKRINGAAPSQSRIVGRIFRDGASAEEIFGYSIPVGQEETPLYPYLCMFGNGTTAKAGQPTCTFDPFRIDKGTPNAFLTDLQPQYGNKFCGVSAFDTIEMTTPSLAYFNLENGGADWTQGPTVATENFVTTNLGFIAQYRRTQVGSPALLQWWQAVDENTWNIYNGADTGGVPPTNASTPSATATIAANGVISVTGTTTTFTPSVPPSRVTPTPNIGLFALPALDESWYQNKGLSANSNISIDRNVLRFMGFGNSITGDNGAVGFSTLPFIINTTKYPYGYELKPSGVFQISLSDNYVVVLDSQKVISYDCSETNSANGDVVGKRMNIIATIPVNNNDGIIEFQASEVLFIDFDNKAPTAIRNLKLRVLDKSLDNIVTSGVSVMTLLIKD